MTTDCILKMFLFSFTCFRTLFFLFAWGISVKKNLTYYSINKSIYWNVTVSLRTQRSSELWQTFLEVAPLFTVRNFNLKPSSNRSTSKIIGSKFCSRGTLYEPQHCYKKYFLQNLKYNDFFRTKDSSKLY